MMYFARPGRLSPFGKLLSRSDREAACSDQVSWFGWNGCFLVPAMKASRAGGPSGSGIAEGNRHGRRAASLNRTDRPRDHDMARDTPLTSLADAPATKKFTADDKKGIDLKHSRFVVLRVLRVKSLMAERTNFGLTDSPEAPLPCRTR